MKKARPHIEAWLDQASNNHRIAVDEFIGVLTRTGDSGSVVDVLEAVREFVGLGYIREYVSDTKGGRS